MQLSSFVLSQALKQLQVPETSLHQFDIVSDLGNVDGRGFPRELFQISAPMIVRGLLNFSILQMHRDWVYPYWVHRQLDPQSESYVARSQNPLLLNITHRDWTMLGSPNGPHEAIVDRCGLITPLPREWSVDTWATVENNPFFLSLAKHVSQDFDTSAPRLTTSLKTNSILLTLEHFVGSTNHGLDVLFNKTTLVNQSAKPLSGFICISVRPFNPEGVAPIHSLSVHSERYIHVNKNVGVVFAEAPDRVVFSNRANGDTANVVRATTSINGRAENNSSIECKHGLANCAAFFGYKLNPGESRDLHYSIALAPEEELKRSSSKGTWRVSFEKRKERQSQQWQKEIGIGAEFRFGDKNLQEIFDASRLALLQLHDGDFISPGPFLYHHFWFRDAAPMVRALDVLGFSKRARRVIDGFPARLRSDGFFQGPDGEWDSNGAVLWTVLQHYRLTGSHLWLKGWQKDLTRAAQWIQQMRQKSGNGLMPASLSAEHLGTVDQYFWDSFWSLSGLQSLVQINHHLQRDDQQRLVKEVKDFENILHRTFASIQQRIGTSLIPATPTRGFDESAIGSICGVYPLQLFAETPPAFKETICEIKKRYTDQRGFLHPFIHSGYNPYLTLQLAHCFLYMEDDESAWNIADSIFSHMQSPYSLPEAIHPKTGGGSMGDGHHGWAAAEVVLFLRDCIIREVDGTLEVFKNAGKLLQKGQPAEFRKAPTSFGEVSISFFFESEHRATLKFSNKFFSDRAPEKINFYVPFNVHRVIPTSPHHLISCQPSSTQTVITCRSHVSTLFLEF